jgi:hypothetical protein
MWDLWVGYDANKVKHIVGIGRLWIIKMISGVEVKVWG